MKFKNYGKLTLLCGGPYSDQWITSLGSEVHLGYDPPHVYQWFNPYGGDLLILIHKGVRH